MVVRNKIETVPWHPAVPTTVSAYSYKRYFETHISIMVNNNELESLKVFCGEYFPDLHFSRNIFKRINDEDFVQMVTLRSMHTLNHNYLDLRTVDQFTKFVAVIIVALNQSGILREGAIMKHVIEYAIYDTNISHDTAWINTN